MLIRFAPPARLHALSELADGQRDVRRLPRAFAGPAATGSPFPAASRRSAAQWVSGGNRISMTPLLRSSSRMAGLLRSRPPPPGALAGGRHRSIGSARRTDHRRRNRRNRRTAIFRCLTAAAEIAQSAERKDPMSKITSPDPSAPPMTPLAAAPAGCHRVIGHLDSPPERSFASVEPVAVLAAVEPPDGCGAPLLAYVTEGTPPASRGATQARCSPPARTPSSGPRPGWPRRSGS
jgi:hypothetical protein